MDRLILTVEASKYLQLKRNLIAQYPEADEDTLLDTLEGITDLQEMIAAVIRSALVDEALHSGLRSRLDQMRERLSRLELRASKKRELALEAMTEAGLSKLEQPDFTASTRARLPCPRASCRSRRSPGLTGCRSRPSSIVRVCLAQLKRGAAIPGAELSNPKPVLMVRTK